MMKKYKVGDKVRVKSLAWYNKNKNRDGVVKKGVTFVSGMEMYCGKIVTIKSISDFVRDEYGYTIYLKEDWNTYSWQAFMFEEKEQLEFEF